MLLPSVSKKNGTNARPMILLEQNRRIERRFPEKRWVNLISRGAELGSDKSNHIILHAWKR